ncbi:MAG: hypothetical protein Kow0070_18640 [Anaerolineales bacterium]
MSPRTVSYGKCFLCGETLAKNAVSRHLAKCLPAHEESGKGQPVRLFHLLVEGRHAPAYWLHLEIPAAATLETLDNFLRAIWLECCGHLSAFTINNVQYELNTGMVDSMWKDFFGPSRPTASMKVKLYQALSVGNTFTHEYDFGTTTELKLKAVSERRGFVPKETVRLLARNYAPDLRCKVCGAPAEVLYVYEYPYEPYCEEHGLEKDEEGLLPVVNSPRVGECGYTGPFEESLRFEERMPAGKG